MELPLEDVKCECRAIKHFDALGIEAKLHCQLYVAPVADYHSDFKLRIPQP